MLQKVNEYNFDHPGEYIMNHVNPILSSMWNSKFDAKLLLKSNPIWE